MAYIVHMDLRVSHMASSWIILYVCNMQIFVVVILHGNQGWSCDKNVYFMTLQQLH